jgi:signal transduction histidine kinase
MRFHLVRYFSFASLAIIVLVATAMVWFERDQGRFFNDVQAQQIAFFSSVQETFARRQDEAARRDLLAIHEAGNVNLTRLFANALWDRDFAPFVARAQGVSFEACRAMADDKDRDGKSVPSAAKKDCYANGGRSIISIPGFKDIDNKVFGAMKKSTVFKIKVFDLRGITIYSSEHKQIGEDKSGNAGWRGAALDGKPTSELTHRDRFSAFEGVVEDRDLISSYLPVVQPGTDRIVGVFEVYSDVTPFLEQIKRTSAEIKKTATANQDKVRAGAESAAAEVDASSRRVIVIVVLLMLVLFGALFVIVLRADRIIKVQEKERENAQQQLAQAEKMASLGQMVAGVAHQLNTPLAFSQSNVQLVQDGLVRLAPAADVARAMARVVERTQGDLATINVAQARAGLSQLKAADVDVGVLRQMLGDVEEGLRQMTELVTHLRDFTRLDLAKTVNADLNKSLHTVVYIARSVISNKIEVKEEFGKLPPVECNPSQLNQVFLNLINNAAQAIDGVGTVAIRSTVDGDWVKVEVADTGSGIPPEVLPKIFDLYFTTKPAGEGTGLGLSIARDVVRQHGGDISVASTVGKGTTFTVKLPVRQAAIRPT